MGFSFVLDVTSILEALQAKVTYPRIDSQSNRENQPLETRRRTDLGLRVPSGASFSFHALAQKSIVSQDKNKGKIKNAKGGRTRRNKKSSLMFLLQGETSCARVHRHEQRTHLVTNTSFTVIM